MDPYDLIVIGGGSAGLTAATIGGRLGARTLLVDKERLGGDCLYYGCVPSKALIRASRLAADMRAADRFGLRPADPGVDIQAVLRTVWKTVETVSQHDSPDHMAAQGVEVAFGSARLLSPTRIRVGDGREVEGRRIVLAVGSHAKAPPIPGLDEVGYIDHVRVFHLESLPKRLAVIGGGPIGLELGLALARLGSQVTVLQGAAQILPRDDLELAARLSAILSRELTIHTGAAATRVSRAGADKVVHYAQDGTDKRLAADEIFVAVGRAPSLEGLDLEAAGVETNRRGIVVDPFLRTTAKGILAAGDCAGGPQFTHYAEAQARIAARNALFRGKQRFDPQGTPWATFTEPELAQVGLTEAAAEEQGLDAAVYRFDYGGLDRAVTDGAGEGMAKVICTKKGQILGASLLGPGAGEAVNELQVAMLHKIPIQGLASAIHVYPTLTRVVRRLGDQRFLERGISGAAKWFARFSPLPPSSPVGGE